MTSIGTTRLEIRRRRWPTRTTGGISCASYSWTATSFTRMGARALERLWAFRLKEGRVQRPEEYYRQHGTLDRWSAAVLARDLGAELRSEVSSALAGAGADWPVTHGASAR